MNRWVVFDAATAAAVGSKTSSRAELRDASAAQPMDVLAAALSASGPAVAVIPASSSERALVLRVTRTERTRIEQESPISGAHVAPGGFLGLADELVLEDEPQPPKKWWQKILD